MDVEGVRTFVAVVEAGQFQDAAIDLRITQQAVSKRIATLERELGTRLFARTARGVQLTLDGRAFLPHAQEILRAVERAAASVRPGERALRVDVIHPRIAPAQALRVFYQTHPGIELDVVTLSKADVTAAITALQAGEIDATFRALPSQPPPGITAERVLDGPLQLLTGPRHPLATARALKPTALTGHRLWIPGIQPGSEWGAFYEALAREFDLQIDAIGPNFGTEALMDEMAGSADLATLVGSGDRYVWPAAYDLRRIPLTDPAPVYPHALLFRTANPHPTLAALRTHLQATRTELSPPTWEPWA